jgi:type II secretory pathway pseudopilin PulG
MPCDHEIAPGTADRIGQAGYTYLVVLFAVVISMAGMAGAVQLWSFYQQREREVELLFVGAEFRRAIGMYYERTPGAAKRYPMELADLLKDNRYPANQRYLRRIYIDPMTGKNEWGLVKAPEGGVMGVYSLSERSPIKIAGFRFADRAFDGKTKYTEWQFAYLPALRAAQIPSPGTPAPMPGTPPLPIPAPARNTGG